MYSNDVDDQVMPSYTLTASSWESAAAGVQEPVSMWSDLIQPYVKNGAPTPANFGQTIPIGLMNDPGGSTAAFNASTVYPYYDYAGRAGYTVLSDYVYAITGFGALHDYNSWLYDGGAYGFSGTCPGTRGGTYNDPCMEPPGNGNGVPGTYQSQVSHTFAAGFASNTSTTQVARPSETIIASDGVTIVHQASAGAVPDFVLYCYPGGGDAVHNGGGNYSFVDGHSKRIAKGPSRLHRPELFRQLLHHVVPDDERIGWGATRLFYQSSRLGLVLGSVVLVGCKGSDDSEVTNTKNSKYVGGGVTDADKTSAAAKKARLPHFGNQPQ